MHNNIYSRKLILLVPLCALLIGNAVAQVKDTTKRSCGSETSYQQLMNAADPETARRYKELDAFTRTYIQNLRQKRDKGISGERSAPIVIPVVFHVLYNNAAENVSDAQLQTQLDVLNRDFRKLNSDVSLAPGAFSPLATDCLIEFRRAVRDPNCMPTSGITRTATSLTSFSVPSTAQSTSLAFNPAKSTAAGGHDAWPRDKYLNIWVCDLASNILGYSSFPGYPANVDGVVIDYQYIGVTGASAAPYNLGRTTTHEIGHWLNLLHIWGDDGTACSGSDQVDDTPNQGGPNFGCPSFPHITCSNGPNGDMSMNYMDYSDDACMYMFTTGQSERADATLYGARSALLASDALIPASGIVSNTPDIFMQDRPDDTGAEPNPSTGAMYQSEDIWVRNQDDGLTNLEHENPLYRSSGVPNYVYVRVRNRSCSGASVSGNLKLYWSNASSGLSYPNSWNGSITTPVLMGNQIGAATPVTVLPGGFQIVKFAWNPPNPADYSMFGSGGSRHFCLLARIETAATAPFGMTFPETDNLGLNVKNNNNIVWKNTTVVNEAPGGKQITALFVGNFSRKDQVNKIYFNSIITSRQQNFLQYGKVTVDLGKDLYDRWVKSGKKGSGIREQNENLITIENVNAWIEGIPVKPNEFFNIDVVFQFTKKIPAGDFRKFEFSIQQTIPDDKEGETVVGGEHYAIKSLRERFTAPAGPSIQLVLKAFLQGAYQQGSGLMTDSLRVKSLIPTASPYPTLNFAQVNNSSDETITQSVLDHTGSDAITDWVMLELREASNPAQVAATRSALIRRDGQVVDMDGTSAVSFPGIPEGNYFIAIRHRNHLGMMTASAIGLSVEVPVQVDFTSAGLVTYGSNARKNVNGVMTLWAGDPNRDGIIRYNGASNDKVNILSRIGLTNPNNILLLYDGADLNLDGMVKYNGGQNDKNIILSNVGLTTPNALIIEQLAK